MVGLDVVEKLFWTNFDFLTMRPNRFRQARLENPSRYMDPVPFAVAMFVLYQAALFGAVRFISPFVDWGSVLGLKLKIPDIPDASSLIAISAPYTLFSYLAFLGLLVLGARIMGQKLRAREAFVALCFACATFSIMVSYIGIATFMIFIEATIVGETTQIAKPLFLGFQLLSLPLLLYFVGSAAAFGDVRFWRLLVGTVVAFISLFVILIILTLVLAALQ
jgi:hypothetical protein